MICGPNLVSLSGFGSAIIVAAPLILATYALMSVALAGRGTVDLAVGPLLAFINVSIVSLNGLGSGYVPARRLRRRDRYRCDLSDHLFALVIIVVRVQPIIVALSGFLALSGINRVILPRPGGVAPDWMVSWGLGNTIFSPVLLILVLATGGWLLFTLSPFYKHLRMMGYDERAAFTAGVRSDIVRIGAHVIAGIFVGLGAICYTALIASGDPTQGTTMSLDGRDRRGARRRKSGGRAGNRYRRPSRSHQPVSDRIRAGDFPVRLGAGLCDAATLWAHTYCFASLDDAGADRPALH